MNNDDVIKRATTARKLVVFTFVLRAHSKKVVIPNHSIHTLARLRQLPYHLYHIPEVKGGIQEHLGF